MATRILAGCLRFKTERYKGCRPYRRPCSVQYRGKIRVILASIRINLGQYRAYIGQHKAEIGIKKANIVPIQPSFGQYPPINYIAYQPHTIQAYLFNQPTTYIII